MSIFGKQPTLSDFERGYWVALDEVQEWLTQYLEEMSGWTPDTQMLGARHLEHALELRFFYEPVRRGGTNDE